VPGSGYAVDQGVYSQTELALVPETALKLSRGCGNPTGFANIRPGDVIVDFGCGGGIDVILAAHRVGPQGKVVGVDFASEMIEKANSAAAEAGLLDRIEFRVADMARTQLPNGFADAVISNCVINLCPDKEGVYKEVFRILRPGGRIAISDIVITEATVPELKARFQSGWTGCLGGAVPEDDYWQTIRESGLTDIQVIVRHILTAAELEAMVRCPGPEFTPEVSSEDLAAVEGKVVSVKFTAVKPG
jgi:arsenite methyltransferase